jgi:hypothetical protein
VGVGACLLVAGRAALETRVSLMLSKTASTLRWCC